MYGRPAHARRGRGRRMSQGSAQERGALVDWLTDQVRAGILAGEVPVGSWLRQEDLAARFGVSRTPCARPCAACRRRASSRSCPGARVRGPPRRAPRDASPGRAARAGRPPELRPAWVTEGALPPLRLAV